MINLIHYYFLRNLNSIFHGVLVHVINISSNYEKGIDYLRIMKK